jgi:diguanylate cyclase (GGDEF)-like protein/PAS domain S-box-containing protein
MTPSGLDICALAARLVGARKAIVVLDAHGDVLLVAGADITGSRKALEKQGDGQGSRPGYNLIRQVFAEDRGAIVRAYTRVASGEVAFDTLNVSARHSDGSLRSLEFRIEGGRDLHPEGATMMTVTDITAADEGPRSRDVDHLEAWREERYYQDVIRELAPIPVDQLNQSIGKALVRFAAFAASDLVVLRLSGPDGRGLEWSWAASSGRTTCRPLHGEGPIRFDALDGSTSELIATTVTMRSFTVTSTRGGATEQTVSKQMLEQGAEVVVSGGHAWGKGMTSELWFGWSVPHAIDVERANRSVGKMSELLQPAFARLAAEAIAKASDRRIADIFQQLSDLVVVWSPSGRIIYASPSVAHLLGVHTDDLTTLHLPSIGRYPAGFAEAIQELKSGETSAMARITLDTAQGPRVIEAVTVNQIENPYVAGYVTTGRDVTARIAEENRQARRDRFTSIIAMISSRFVNGTSANLDRNIRASLSDLTTFVGVDRTCLWQRGPSGDLSITHEASAKGDLIGSQAPPIQVAAVQELVPRAAQGGVQLCLRSNEGLAFIEAIEVKGPPALEASLVVGLRTDSGLIGLLTFSNVADSLHGLDGIRSTEAANALLTVGELMANVLDRTVTQAALAHSATHDALTGLANRRLLIERCERMLGTAHRRGNGLGVMLLDLDDFKIVNDTLGHDAGDELLSEVANRLRGFAQGSTVIARLGGDEFVLLVEAPDPEKIVCELANRIRGSLAAGFTVRGRRISVKTSIGAVVSTWRRDSDDLKSSLPSHDQSPSDLFRRADMAMYAAKHQGGDGFRLFNESLEAQTQRRFNLHEELAQAIRSNDLELWFQPQVHLRTKRIIGCEALVRWRHPEKGYIFPNEFIGVAEQTGLIRDLGAWVMNAAAEHVATWIDRGLVDEQFAVAINVSAMQLLEPTLVIDLVRICNQFGLSNQRIGIELTESTLAERDRVIPNLRALREAGFTVAVDDFGTGYSSLSYLRDMPLTDLKIDRSFVQSIEQDRRDYEMVSALVAMARALGLGVVAEGIETDGQLELLTAMGCEHGQGWLFSKAVPGDVLVTALQSHVLAT